MLNGCRTENVRYEITPNGTRIITQTMKAGYLDRDQLAFVYCLVCAMRKIPSSDFMEGLSAEATQAIRSCKSSFGHQFAPRFHESEQTQESVDRFRSEVTQAQYVMAELDKHVTYISTSFCDTEDSGDLFVTCPKCKYDFAYNTSVLSFSESPAPRNVTWWRKVRNLMRRKESG
jgi:hypothetical protein